MQDSPSIEERDLWIKRADAYLEGKEVPMHEASQYAVGQLREAKAQMDVLAKRLQQLEQQATAMREDFLRFEGIALNCVKDIRHWETRHAEAASKPPSALAAAN